MRSGRKSFSLGRQFSAKILMALLTWICESKRKKKKKKKKNVILKTKREREVDWRQQEQRQHHPRQRGRQRQHQWQRQRQRQTEHSSRRTHRQETNSHSATTQKNSPLRIDVMNLQQGETNVFLARPGALCGCCLSLPAPGCLCLWAIALLRLGPGNLEMVKMILCICLGETECALLCSIVMTSMISGHTLSATKQPCA